MVMHLVLLSQTSDAWKRNFTAAKYQDSYPIMTFLGRVYGFISDPGVAVIIIVIVSVAMVVKRKTKNKEKNKT